MTFKVAIITISDSCAAGTAVDTSGPELQKLLAQPPVNITIALLRIIPDDCDKIEEALRDYVDVHQVDCILTTGGTGFSPRDVTPEATKRVIEREAPQLALLMALTSIEKTKFAALSRGVCGIRGATLIINFPGSRRAVIENFEAIRELLPHAIELVTGRQVAVMQKHAAMGAEKNRPAVMPTAHVCPHKTNTGKEDDRNSPWPMVTVQNALSVIKGKTASLNSTPIAYVSELDLPPFRASLKDGYAVCAADGVGEYKIIHPGDNVESIRAGDTISNQTLTGRRAFKINTGAAVPLHANAVIQVEDTRVLERNSSGMETKIQILKAATVGQDIRPVGTDLKKGDVLFSPHRQIGAAEIAVLASVGRRWQGPARAPTVHIVSTGSELVSAHSTGKQPLLLGKIYDSNTPMLEALVYQFGFKTNGSTIVADNFGDVVAMLDKNENCDVIICTGGVSMGDKDYVKSALQDRKFEIAFGRVNVKPGKPMTYATKKRAKDKSLVHFFGLPGNPVSAFVTFHLFVLPALRRLAGWSPEELPVIEVTLTNDSITLDPRPEYVRATVVAKNGKFEATITGNQLSSRVKSLIDAGVLLHLPGSTKEKPTVQKGTVLKATVIKHDFLAGM